MAVWSHIGTDDYQNANGTGQTSFSVTAGTIGDLRTVRFHTMGNDSVSSLSGGGVSQWWRFGNAFSATATGATTFVETWFGQVVDNTSGSATSLSITYASSIGSIAVRMNRADFRSARGLRVENINAIDTSTAHDGTTPLATFSWGSRTTKYDNELYIGYAWLGSTPSSGSTAGYVYATDADSNINIYNLNVGPNTVEAPSYTQGSSSNYITYTGILTDGHEMTSAVNNQAVMQSAVW